MRPNSAIYGIVFNCVFCICKCSLFGHYIIAHNYCVLMHKFNDKCFSYQVYIIVDYLFSLTAFFFHKIEHIFTHNLLKDKQYMFSKHTLLLCLCSRFGFTTWCSVAHKLPSECDGESVYNRSV